MAVLRTSLSILAGLAVVVSGQSTTSTTGTTAVSTASTSSVVQASTTAAATTSTTSTALASTDTTSTTSDLASSTLSSSTSSDLSSTTSSTATSLSTSTTSTSSTTTTSSSTSTSTTETSASTAQISISLATSTDASSYMAYAFPTATPTWATGQYYTQLASALYAVDKSFVERSDYQSITSAIYSAGDIAGSSVSASLDASAFGWGVVTTNTWYQSAVPTAYQTEVLDYNSAWNSAENSVKALATASKAGAAMSRCTGMAMVGVAAGVIAAVAGVL